MSGVSAAQAFAQSDGTSPSTPHFSHERSGLISRGHVQPQCHKMMCWTLIAALKQRQNDAPELHRAWLGQLRKLATDSYRRYASLSGLRCRQRFTENAEGMTCKAAAPVQLMPMSLMAILAAAEQTVQQPPLRHKHV